MLRWLQPIPTLTQQDTQRSLRLMRWDVVLASAIFSLEQRRLHGGIIEKAWPVQ